MTTCDSCFCVEKKNVKNKDNRLLCFFVRNLTRKAKIEINKKISTFEKKLCTKFKYFEVFGSQNGTTKLQEIISKFQFSSIESVVSLLACFFRSN